MSYQPNNQSSLDKLMQMATLEQLNNMMQQLNKNTNTNSISNAKETTDILSLPLVQKVVMAYEDELKTKKNTVGCQLSVNDFVPLFDTVLSKMDEQTREYNSNLLRIENKVDQLFALLEKQERERQEREKHQQSVDVDKSQLKLTSFPCFFRKYDMFDLTVNEEIISEKHIEEETVKEEIICEKYIEEETVKSEEYKENITLKIEEKDILESDEDSDDVIEDPPVTRLTIEEDEVVDDELNDDEVSDEEAAEDKVVEDDDLNDDEASDEEAAEDKVAIEDEAVSVEEDEVVSVEEEEAVSVEESEEEVRTEDGSEEIDNVVEVKEDIQDVDVDVDEEEEEEEVFEIEIDDVTYFATDEENGILYEVDNGDVGRKVGIIKDGEPIFS